MKHVIIVLHGYDQVPESYNEIKTVIVDKYADASILIPKLKLSKFSVVTPDDVVAPLLRTIDEEWQKEIAHIEEGEQMPKVVLIGHSTGALLVRKLFVAACGENSDAPLGDGYTEKKEPKKWATHVDRIILLAGMNRGWTLNPHLYTKTAFLMRIGVFLGHIMKLLGYEPLAFKTRRGSPFITQLRIQWLSMIRHSRQKKIGNVPVIQLLGTKDDIISPQDNIDILTGSNFIYLEVPESNHMTVLKVKSGTAG